MPDRLADNRRRALDLLAELGLAGSTESALLARGFTVELIAGLVRAGFPTVVTETVMIGGRPTEIAYVRITETGCRALEGPTDTE
jgi:hypothetical protein